MSNHIDSKYNQYILILQLTFLAVLSHGLRLMTPRMMTAIPTSTVSNTASTLKGYEGFVRSNPMSDKISTRKFHHIEFYCGDSTTTYKRFMYGLGMDLVSKSDLSTGNTEHSSYVLQSGDIRMIFTAPYFPLHVPHNVNDATDRSSDNSISTAALADFSRERAINFTSNHGLGVCAVAIEVDNVSASYSTLVSNGGIGVLPPTTSIDSTGRGWMETAEVHLYGDVLLRLVNTDNFKGRFLSNFIDLPSKPSTAPGRFGLFRFDHIVGNLWTLEPKMTQFMSMTGFHEFAEFVASDVGTVDSGLNSVVLANNNELVLLPINEPTYGTPRKSQIQTYLEQNRGEGVQHLALFSTDIVSTLRQMRALSDLGGFEFIDPPGASYYKNMRVRIGDALSEEILSDIEELGILADKDDRGVLLQIFTKPIGDRPTLFLEIIQRIGCMEDGQQQPGCGGFGKGNFRDLFKAIEDYEKSLGVQ